MVDTRPTISKATFNCKRKRDGEAEGSEGRGRGGGEDITNNIAITVSPLAIFKCSTIK